MIQVRLNNPCIILEVVEVEVSTDVFELWTFTVTNTYEAYFGGGTKLTVLGKKSFWKLL